MVVEKNSSVFPGTVLGTEEEYVAGKNTAVNEQGNVISCVVGKPEINPHDRKAEVKKPGANAFAFEAGDTAIGRITLVKESSAVLEIQSAERNGVQKKVVRSLASIMVRMIDSGYVKKVSDKFRIGDIVKAKIVSVTRCGVDCGTSEGREFGVVKAFCRRCRQPLHLFGMELKCLSCGSLETRKISSDYLLK